MRTLFYSLTIMLLSMTNAWSVAPKDRYVIPLKNDIAVFSNTPTTGTERPPAFVVGTNDRLLVLETKGDLYKVRNLKGDIGWVSKASVKEVAPSKTFSFDTASVLGFLDNPTPIFILDATDSLNKGIALDRSFDQEIKENIDEETIDRIVEDKAAKL